jgi:3-isopropylmalate/(R)-2-methylmalate dehydratase large subunit
LEYENNRFELLVAASLGLPLFPNAAQGRQASWPGRTLYDKLWDNHLVEERADGSALIYIDRHLIHEVTSPQAFEGSAPGRSLSPGAWLPTWRCPITTCPRARAERAGGVAASPIPCRGCRCRPWTTTALSFGIEEIPINDRRQGIVHVVGPEQGATLPGMTVVCGDSHTSTHGALGALAHGIGTSEVEHVLATQCLVSKKMKNMRVRIDGVLPVGVTAKDLALAIIGEIGTAGGTGYAIEFAGEAVRALSMEGRMTLCNMSIEAGARMGMVAVDDVTLDYVRGRPMAPRGSRLGSR